ncbi:ABC transporter [Patescibacteria group bacterium]|nr:MAG: ABC transporter [Patescibacteria group bacterium]
MNVIGTATLVRRELDRSQRVAVQAIITPWLSAGLFMLVFGKIVGARIGDIGGASYVEFVLPGVLMMNLLSAAFMQSCSALYFQRFLKNIEEVLIAPFSYDEMILAFVFSGMMRGFIIAAGILGIGLLFGATGVAHPLWFVFFLVVVALLFSLLGLLVGLWANGFEQLSLFPTFLITPLTFLGGMFNTPEMLPPAVRPLLALNPFWYMIDGLRYAMIGTGDSNHLVGAAFLIILAAASFLLVRQLFARGWRLRT